MVRRYGLNDAHIENMNGSDPNYCADCGMSIEKTQNVLNKECPGFLDLKGVMYYHDWTGRTKRGVAYSNSIKKAIIREGIYGKIIVEWNSEFGNGYLEMATVNSFNYEGIYIEGGLQGKTQGKLYTATNGYFISLEYQDSTGARGVWFIELSKVKYNEI